MVETAEQRRELDAVMLRDDVSWWTSLVTSAVGTDWEPTVGLSILPQVARVLHEGLGQLKRVSPEAVERVTAGWDVDIATARHTVKLLDDDKKSVDSVLNQFASIAAEHTAAFSTLNDFALLESDGRALASTRLASYQAAADLNDRWAADEGSRSFNLGQTMGQRTVELQRALGMGDPVIRQVTLPAVAVPRLVDTTAVLFDATSYPDFGTPSVKDLLLMVECSVNAALWVFAPTATTHRSSLFRVRFVVATHALSALAQIFERFDADTGATAQQVEAVLQSEQAARVLQMRALRNRSMHYGIPKTLTGLSASKPAYGLVEATTSRAARYAEVEADVVELLTKLSDALRDWRRA
ncbi:hypothetical protein [Curtobacterium poinsettiae]|uniref:hypothetical protein n=1 Tax=Curtobacterium TaxID=2034 RepID=UPI00217D3CE0|nr:hypothetical protein [Curtobacterium flaccumfaciens]MCS6562450.1 hypothetical protein [Curtobacterium flaccumfaciens pv. poinsettiae]